MDLSDILNTFFHSEKRFFPQLQKMADLVVEGANLLTDMISLEEEKYKQEEAYGRIKTLETDCDQITAEIFNSLNDAWLTPLPKADIHQLCDTLDDVMDNINASAKRMMLYQPHSMSNRTMHLAEIVIECAKAIREAFTHLDDLKHRSPEALEQSNRLHELEHEGDDVYGDFVEELFNSDIDPIELIKIKEIMASLESATDCANKVGKTIKTIIVKYK